MAAEGRDIRELTRTMSKLERAIEALNNTLVETERRRREETESPLESFVEDADDASIKRVRQEIKPKKNLFNVCLDCLKDKCQTDIIYSRSCDCCKVNHALITS